MLTLESVTWDEAIAALTGPALGLDRRFAREQLARAERTQRPVKGRFYAVTASADSFHVVIDRSRRMT